MGDFQVNIADFSGTFPYYMASIEFYSIPEGYHFSGVYHQQQEGALTTLTFELEPGGGAVDAAFPLSVVVGNGTSTLAVEGIFQQEVAVYEERFLD